MNYILGNWDWYIAGPLIGLFVPLLLIAKNNLFGISSSFTHLCAMMLPESKRGYLNYNFKKDGWKLYFVIGIILGAVIAVTLLSAKPVSFLPASYFSWKGYLYLFAGGICIGFGTRYADGCTAGHAITGLSLLSPASLKATISFFIGGVIYTFIAVNVF